MNVRGFLVPLLIAAALFICAGRPASAAPALWVVQGPAGKVYLFGTVHLLRDGTQWRSPELEAAMKESQDLYLEIADPTDAASAVPSLVKLGFDRDHPLSTKISKSDVVLLGETAKRYNLGTEATFEPMRPWLVFLMLSAMPALHSGYSSANGVDLQVRKEFVAAAKPIYGLETFEMQAHIFADMPDAAQITLLEAELKNMNQPQTGDPQLNTIVNAWTTGNQDDLATSMQLDKLAQSPTFAQVFTNRNKAWAAALAARLKQPGTSFVSVGAGHMLGPYGVPALLAQMGFKVTRVPIAQVSPSSSPSPLPDGRQQPTSSPSPMPTASPTPIPRTLTPPAGWSQRHVSLASGPFKADMMWIDPNGRGVIMSGHLDVPSSLGLLDLNTLDALVHQGLMTAAGAKAVQPSTRVKICGGKQDGTYTRVTLPTVNEYIVLTVSDRGYLAQYARRSGVAEDLAATRSLLSLCAP